MKIRYFLKLTCISLAILLNSCHSSVQKKDAYTATISSLPKVIHESDDFTITQLSENAFQHQSFLQTQSFGKVSCNGMIIRDNNEAVIFDTTSDSLSSAALIQWVQKQLKCKITAVVPTHFHTDNLGGLKAFEQAGIPSFANFKTIQYAKDRKENIPQNGFNDLLEIKVGNKNVIAKFFGEGHTKDNIVGYFPEEKILFGGCLIKEMNANKGNLADANENDWSETVMKIKKSYPDVLWVIPGTDNTVINNYWITRLDCLKNDCHGLF